MTFRGVKDMQAVVDCIRHGAMVWEKKTVPYWWPWRWRIDNRFDDIYLTHQLVTLLLHEQHIEGSGQTGEERIYRLHARFGRAKD